MQTEANIANLYKQFKTIANCCIPLQNDKRCRKGLQTVANRCKKLQTITSCLQTIADRCTLLQTVQIVSNRLKPFQIISNRFKRLQILQILVITVANEAIVYNFVYSFLIPTEFLKYVCNVCYVICTYTVLYMIGE
jgi:hypothetical protein